MFKIQWAELKVRDLARQQEFYRELFDWEPVADGPARVQMGPLRLVQDRQARVPDRAQPGLFHLAYLAPDEAALAGWLQRAAERGVRLEGASDHGASQALYLSDPEGNGIEVYADRPRDQWPGAPGPVELYTHRLDLPKLLGKARPWSGPEGFAIGHVHFRALDPYQGADWFHKLGLQVTVHYPGAEFYAADGYHHHFAVNNWGVTPSPQGSWTGLSGYALRGQFPSQSTLDPWGHQVELISAAS